MSPPPPSCLPREVKENKAECAFSVVSCLPGYRIWTQRASLEEDRKRRAERGGRDAKIAVVPNELLISLFAGNVQLNIITDCLSNSYLAQATSNMTFPTIVAMKASLVLPPNQINPNVEFALAVRASNKPDSIEFTPHLETGAKAGHCRMLGEDSAPFHLRSTDRPASAN
ncbi:putative Spc7 kinetochore protein [Colletotrichum sublineola]|uniref:Putative Spc7 kinetochore protein n=1 Tax=Colletotrichum sublineola TaxID=1173701 RepID=A0A066XT34_COLSU|nr:putative Spc7 kinetochore protein [Colletotrichum sublineola]